MMSNFTKENAAAILRVQYQYPEVKRENRCLAKAAKPKFPQEQTILFQSFFYIKLPLRQFIHPIMTFYILTVHFINMGA